MRGRIEAVSVSSIKGVRKIPQLGVELVEGQGLQGDVHAEFNHRQVSMLAVESIDKLRALGASVAPGDFAENITLRGIDLSLVAVGTRLSVGEKAILEITQLGKDCLKPCSIFYQVGDCVMPREGVFARVLRGGKVEPGQTVIVWPKFRAMVITLSDRCFRGETIDESGPAVINELALRGAEVESRLLADDYDALVELLAFTSDNYYADIIFTTGGTGLSPRDITPEATLAVIEKVVPGLAEAMRAFSLQVTPAAMLSRAVAGTRKQSLIINLPGSKKGALECLAVVVPALCHALEVIAGLTIDCGRLPV